MNIYMYIYLVTELKHVISINNIVTLNKTPKNVSSAIVELTNIDGSSFENGVLFF